MMRVSLSSTLAFAALALSMPYAGLSQPQSKGKMELKYGSIRPGAHPRGDQLLLFRCLNGRGRALLRNVSIFLALLATGSFKVR